MCYAESDDGVHWVKPELGLVDFKGGTKNNICLIEGEPFALTRVNDFLSVRHEPEDPSHLLGVHVDLGLIVSNDGIHFREPCRASR